MSPEIGVLFVALLWGPTALWLVYRTLRGRRGRLSGPFSRSQLAPDELEAVVGSDGFWACGTCRSLNRGEAERCYKCRMAKGAADRLAPSELPISPGVPVMAKGAADRLAPSELPISPGVPVMAKGAADRLAPSELPISPGVPVMAKGAADRLAPSELPISPGVPVMAKDIARPAREPAGTTVALASPRNAGPAPEVLVRTPEKVLFAASSEAPAGAPICPFLRSPNEPSTPSDIPDQANLCGLDQYFQPIAVEFQQSRCVTAAHTRCARYTGADVPAGTISSDGA